MFTTQIKKVAEILSKYKKFLITSTKDADGDSVGAQLALYNILNGQLKGKRKDKILKVVNEGRCPKRYTFLPDSEKILGIDEVGAEKFDVGFVLDGGSERIGRVKPMFNACRVKVLIDHHKFGSGADYNIRLYRPSISSTAEIIYAFIESDIFSVSLNKRIAAQIYLGLIYDTGLFRHTNTSPRTLMAASNCIKTGIDFSDIVYQGLMAKEPAAQRLLAKVLTGIEFTLDGRVAYSVLTEDMLKQTGANEDDQEGIIDQLIVIQGVSISVLFKEYKNDLWKISFRSKGKLDVGQLARSLDEKGGGHEKASGCLLKGNIDTITGMVLSKIGSTIDA